MIPSKSLDWAAGNWIEYGVKNFGTEQQDEHSWCLQFEIRAVIIMQEMSMWNVLFDWEKVIVRCYNAFSNVSNLQLHPLQADDTFPEPVTRVQLAAGEIGSVTGTALEALDVARREGTMLSPSSSHCCFCRFCLPKIFKEFQRHWKGDESCLFSACASIVVIIQTSEISKVLLVAPVYYRRSLCQDLES